MNVRRLPAYRAAKLAFIAPSLLACSGGIDSSALLVLAVCARHDGMVAPVVVYVDHQSREESARDGVVVKALARRFDLSFELVLTTGSGLRSEARLREERYAALSRVGHSLGISRVVTAHNRDDQVETILMRLMSGSGALGAAGMRAEQRLDTEAGPIDVVRPLLEVSRSDLQEIVAASGVAPISDQSNSDRSIRRNALRLDIVPRLREITPGFEDGLLRSVRLAANDAAFADDSANQLWDRIIVEAVPDVNIDRNTFRQLHSALAGRIVRCAALRLIDSDDTRELTEERVLAVVSAASGRTGTAIELPYGIVVRVERERILMQRRAGWTATEHTHG